MEANNKVAVVTGGCSGLGNATVNVLLKAGVKVAIFDLNEQQGVALVQALGEEFGADNVMFAKVDVSSAESVASAMDTVIEIFGALHICVNCAGIAPAKRLLSREGEAMPLEDFQKVVDVNLVGSFNVARLAAEKMAKNEPFGEAQERGIIVNTSSVAGFEGQVGQCSYSASKGGILGINLPMARDLAPWGIRVNAIAPGIMGTPMLLGMPENIQQALVEDIQFPKRLGQPQEFGRLVLHMVENSYLNGETIRLDGAIRLQPK
ncbi:MAG: SDR family NAD(P)-dependent oxidoreductase [Pseudomonadota bacterium]